MTSKPLNGLIFALCAAACSDDGTSPDQAADYYGTLEPFAAEAVYFVVTDRFVDGDSQNNFVQQGGESVSTFDRPVEHPQGGTGNIGYLGGDFQGVFNNAQYIADMGFTAVWLTPIVDNPDEAFSGGMTLEETDFADNGKTGYHGYWGVNFFEVDEHLVSEGLSFSEFTGQMKGDFGLKTILDVVCNHGSPAFSMPVDQPKFGEIYDAGGTLVADHQNLEPADLDDENPLHRFFRQEPDIAQLSNMNDVNPAVLDYFVAAYLHWIDQGADAFRIDTIKHMPHAYWKSFSDRIRAEHPGFFMFGESFDYSAEKIAEHTYPENGAINVLDFPGKQAMNEVFANAESDFADIVDYLHLDDGVYQSPYEQMIFYDNHDMPRMDASDNGFIDAHNWLFTSRGIPVVYYGSEVGFRAGKAEHRGNRDYFGQENVTAAEAHPVRAALSAIANIRQKSVALQRGLQFNLNFAGDTASFLRVYQRGGDSETALVLLNKGDTPADFVIDQWLSAGDWLDVTSGDAVTTRVSQRFTSTVPAHGVRVYVSNEPVSDAALVRELEKLQKGARRN